MLKTGYNLTKEEIVKKSRALSRRRGLGEKFNRCVISIADNLRDKRILDVGCAHGKLLMEIVKSCPGNHLYSINQIKVHTREVSQELDKIVQKPPFTL